CVASRMKVSERITSSSALIDFSRPTKSGTIMCGNTTMSRKGNTGKARVSPGTRGAFGLAGVFMAPDPSCCAPPSRTRGMRSHDGVPLGREGNTDRLGPRPQGGYETLPGRDLHDPSYAIFVHAL